MSSEEMDQLCSLCHVTLKRRLKFKVISVFTRQDPLRHNNKKCSLAKDAKRHTERSTAETCSRGDCIIYIYIYIYMCVCVCVGLYYDGIVCLLINKKNIS